MREHRYYGGLQHEHGHERGDETDVPQLQRDGIFISRRTHYLHRRRGAFDKGEHRVDDHIRDAHTFGIKPHRHLYGGRGDDAARHDEQCPVDETDDVPVLGRSGGHTRPLCGEPFRQHHARAHDASHA